MSFSGKNILITGASGLIGRAYVDRFLELGFTVCAQVNTGELKARPNLHVIAVAQQACGPAVGRVLQHHVVQHPAPSLPLGHVARHTFAAHQNAGGEVGWVDHGEWSTHIGVAGLTGF